MGSGSSKGVAVTGQSPIRATPGNPPKGSPKNGGPKSSTNNNSIQYRETRDLTESTPVNTLMENVFLVTKGRATGDSIPAECVLVKEPDPGDKENLMLTRNNIGEIVFERLMMKRSDIVAMKTRAAPANNLFPIPIGRPQEPWALNYLYHCYTRLKAIQDLPMFTGLEEDIRVCQELIFTNTKTCMQQHVMFQPQMVPNQFIDVCLEHKDRLSDNESRIYAFIIGLLDVVDQDSDPGCMSEVFKPVLHVMKQRFLKHRSFTNSQSFELLTVLQVFTWRESLATVFMAYNEPGDQSIPVLYEQTLLGAILSLSSCPREASGTFEFFDNPLDMKPADINATTAFIWQRLNDVCEEVYKTLLNIIKLSPNLRHMVLDWLGTCIAANRGKPDVWCAHEVEVFSKDFCSDGFCLNLCHVMLKLCRPFSEPNCEKLLRITPSYSKADPKSPDDRKKMAVHARGLSKEKMMVPYTDDRKMDQPRKPHHFICECFFLTQQIFHVSYNIVYKVLKLNNNVNRLDQLQRDMRGVFPTQVMNLVRQQLRKEICLYLNMKAALQHLLQLSLGFQVASVTWLIQVAFKDDVTSFDEPKFPLPKNIPKTLSHLPEFVVTNFTVFVLYLDMSKHIDMLRDDPALLSHFMTFVLIYMGHQERLVNSDVRAQLADALESILPKLKDDFTWEPTKTGNVESMFKSHPLVEHLAETLVRVFVSIEMTGQSVESEKKFNYRKSIHKILQYIWRIPKHKEAFKTLSKKAMTDIDNTDPPLFLRFINLLINDAIFLLDDGLDHMKQIREQEQQKYRGEWEKLSAEQYRDKESGLRHLNMIGRYRNTLANYTIYSLEIVTREIRDIFCHPMMVDRIAGMLNYFLEQLVGPKQADYKVRDRQDLEFKPEQIVSDITHIYLYLGNHEIFCKAVLGESRSFSHDLMNQAIIVLNKIGISDDFIARFVEFKEKLQSMETDLQREEEEQADAPDEFLDPIMGTLMLEPVILPTSNTTVDRAVIARHLLSDQTDPFNRQPLSLDMVKPNNDLKQKIEKWRTQPKPVAKQNGNQT